MDTKKPEAALNPEEEFRRLREKTGRDELSELKHGLMGGYRRHDVEAYVARLKDQLQTAERTFKNHIAELSAEKDQLRYERDVLQGRLERQQPEPAAPALTDELFEARKAAEGFLADRGTLEEQLRHVTRMSDEAVADLQSRKDALEAELQLAREREEALQGAADAARAEAHESVRTEMETLKAEKEGLQVQLEALAARAGQSEAEYRGALQDLISNIEAEQTRTASAEERLAEAARQLESLAVENAALAARLETSGKSIENLLEEKEAVDGINAQLRKALNSLVVRAEAVIKENGVVNALLESERERAQQYQALNGRLVDMLARVRMASQMLDERVADMDRALVRGEPAPGRAAPAAQLRRRTDPQEPADAKCNPLKDIITELNVIQENLAQYQQPSRLPGDGDNKPNNRYRVDKLEVDCPPAKGEKPRDGIEDRISPFAANRFRECPVDEDEKSIS